MALLQPRPTAIQWTYTIFLSRTSATVEILRTNVLDQKHNSDLQSALNIIARELRAEIQRNPRKDIVINSAVRPFLYFRNDYGAVTITVKCPDMLAELREFLTNPVVVVPQPSQPEPRTGSLSYPLVDRFQQQRDAGSCQSPPPSPPSSSRSPPVRSPVQTPPQNSTPLLMPHHLEWVRSYEQQHGNPDNGGLCSLGQLSRALHLEFGISIATKPLGRILVQAGLRKQN